MRDEGRREGGKEGKNGHTEMRIHKDDSRNATLPSRKQHQKHNIFSLIWAYFNYNRLEGFLSPNISSQLRHEKQPDTNLTVWPYRFFTCSAENKNCVAALILGSPGKPEARGWQMMNMDVSIHTGTHQSITNTLSRKGMGESEQQRGLQGAWGEKERDGLLSFLKGCEQVATPSGLQLQELHLS